jgi:uncharacterized membrane protein YeaQ/YmgE (transglycosylase-associated protein family)
MALIHCPECRREISNSSKACIQCGFILAGSKKRINWMHIFGICIYAAGSFMSYLLGTVYEVITGINYAIIGDRIVEEISYDFNRTLFITGLVVTIILGTLFLALGQINKKL